MCGAIITINAIHVSITSKSFPLAQFFCFVLFCHLPLTISFGHPRSLSERILKEF